MEFCPTPRLPLFYQNSSKIAMFQHCLNYKSLFFSQNSRKTAMLPKKISFSSFFCFFSYTQWWTSPIPLPFFCPLIPPKGECGLRHCVSLKQPVQRKNSVGLKIDPPLPSLFFPGGWGCPSACSFPSRRGGDNQQTESYVYITSKGSPAYFFPLT